MLRLYSLVFLLHAYIGLRLIPAIPFGMIVKSAMILWLTASAVLLPFSFLARRIERQPLSDQLAWAGLLAMGFFSSLLVLTVLRDLSLLVAWVITSLLLKGVSLELFKQWSALAVPLLAVLFTLVG